MITHLTPSLIGVPVHIDCINFEVFNGSLWFSNEDNDGDYVELPLGNWSIVGEVERGRMDFNPHEFLEQGNHVVLYKDYSGKTDGFVRKTNSFYSLLASKGAYWVNPLGEKPKYVPIVGGFEVMVDNERNRVFRERLQAWQEAESKKLTEETKVVILKSNAGTGIAV